MESKKTTRYREYINRPEIAVCVGVQDCIGARLVEQTGFDLAFVHDFGLSATFLGQPDMGLITLTEMTVIIEKIIKAVELPVIADGGCGFGNPLNTHRTVEEFESIGAAGVNIEDQVYPKRCGHLAGKEIISTEEMNDKIQAACDARKDEDFVIVARTDAIAVDGVDEAIRRGNAYARAGADMIFVEAPETKEDIERIVKSLEAPCWVNMVEGGKTPLVPTDELQKMGAALVALAGARARRQRAKPLAAMASRWPMCCDARAAAGLSRSRTYPAQTDWPWSRPTRAVTRASGRATRDNRGHARAPPCCMRACWPWVRSVLLRHRLRR